MVIVIFSCVLLCHYTVISFVFLYDYGLPVELVACILVGGRVGLLRNCSYLLVIVWCAAPHLDKFFGIVRSVVAK